MSITKHMKLQWLHIWEDTYLAKEDWNIKFKKNLLA